MTREDLKESALKAFRKHSNIAIQAGTGVGKSRIAIELIKSRIEASRKAIKVLFVVAEIAHKDNWEAEITKWGLGKCYYEIICYASLKKYKDTHWDCIVFDEAHHLNTDIRLTIFESIKANSRIFLSATLGESLFNTLQAICETTIENITCGLQEAINSSILPEPKIVLVPMTLDNTISNQVIVEEWGRKTGNKVTLKCLYKDRWKYLKTKKQYASARLEIYCTQQQYYDYLSDQFEYYKNLYFSCRNEAIKNKWLQCGSKRKRLLGTFKTEIAKDLLKTLKKKRFICFCTSIEQANYLGGETAIHSNKKDSFKVIQDFNAKKIDNIFAVGMLQEGVNLTDIEAGIIIQLDGEERAFIQKLGRCLRAESPIQYILYYKGTRDEEYLNNALEGINADYIEYYNV